MTQESLDVDVESAHRGGMASAYAAARLKDLPEDFSDTADAAEDVTGGSKNPGVSGWKEFGNKYMENMMDVSQHAENLAENIKEGSVDVATTHLEAVDEFAGVDGAPQRF
ncbi:MAG: hypothetical protein JK586_06170 [Nocardiopsis sp. BM-2018]|nr:MAG: hypothetical protein JK586_06170 [Nocardiopsis sp. BM-2018]